MSYQSGRRNLDYARIAKFGLFAGIGLFAIGAVGEFVGHIYLSGLPAIADQTFLALEAIGIIIALFVPIIFGAVLPLIE